RLLGTPGLGQVSPRDQELRLGPLTLHGLRQCLALRPSALDDGRRAGSIAGGCGIDSLPSEGLSFTEANEALLERPCSGEALRRVRQDAAPEDGGLGRCQAGFTRGDSGSCPAVPSQLERLRDLDRALEPVRQVPAEVLA